MRRSWPSHQQKLAIRGPVCASKCACVHVSIVWVCECVSARDCKRDDCVRLGEQGSGVHWSSIRASVRGLHRSQCRNRRQILVMSGYSAMSGINTKPWTTDSLSLSQPELTRARLHDRKLAGRCQRVVVHVAILVLDDDRLAANVVPVRRYNNALAAGSMNHLHITLYNSPGDRRRAACITFWPSART